MAILSSFPTTQWKIQLDTVLPSTLWDLVLAAPRLSLVPANIEVENNDVINVTGAGIHWVITVANAVYAFNGGNFRITGSTVMQSNIVLNPSIVEIEDSQGVTHTVVDTAGSGTEWTLTLENPVLTLAPSDITIPGATVVSTDNASISGFMEQIRNLLRIGITSEDLPDSTIREYAFLRAAELATYEKTQKTEAAFDTESLTDTALRDRFRISTMYRTAALLVPALPDIVREEFLSELRQYVQMDWEQKINFYNTQADDVVKDDIPAGAGVSSVGSVGSRYTRYTAF